VFKDKEVFKKESMNAFAKIGVRPDTIVVDYHDGALGRLLRATTEDGKYLIAGWWADGQEIEDISWNVEFKESEFVFAQVLYDLREIVGFCGGDDLHEFFRMETGGEPSPSGWTYVRRDHALEWVLSFLKEREEDWPVERIAKALMGQ